MRIHFATTAALQMEHDGVQAIESRVCVCVVLVVQPEENNLHSFEPILYPLENPCYLPFLSFALSDSANHAVHLKYIRMACALFRWRMAFFFSVK